MDLKVAALLVLFAAATQQLLRADGGGLSFDFYDQTCPQAEDIVRTALRSMSLADISTPAAMLRLMFHDCQVQGCDASILLDTHTEMTSVKNFGIRKRETLSLMKSMVEAVCPQQVSCADILILAAREAVAISGGPRIRVPLGRRDSSTPSSSRLADASLPPANIGVDGMLQVFSKKGMTIEESVAILGAHTIGVTHCFNLQSRLYRQEGGGVRVKDRSSSTQPGFDEFLKLSCPAAAAATLVANTSFVVNDPTTVLFDNNYYKNALSGKGILNVDAEMPLDPRTAPYVRRFAADQDYFFRAFSSAFVKLSSSGVLTGKQGVIRRYCNALE